MKNITRILSAALALCLLAALCLPARADGTQDCGAKLLAITFDDGPGKYTGALLDGLAERGVHATFFVNGVNASGWPETLKRIVNEGHQLANHTYNHKNLNTCSAQTVAYEISAVQALITAAGGDADIVNIVEDTTHGVFDGAIILVHDIYKTSVDGALAAIDDLLAEGYEFVTVQDLLLRRGVTPEAATVYYSAKNNGINLPADAVGEQAFDESRIETHWGYAAMKTCLDYGWMMLTDTGEWKPNAFVTRAEFAADLARFAGIHTLYPLEGAARFSDVDLTAADAPYLAWAADSGIVAGYDDGTFRPEKTLTREQMAVMLARYYARSGVTTQGSLDFTDAAKISGWAVDGVSVCVGLGLVQGDPRGRFLPQSRLTRAQIASILVRMAG